MKQVLMLVAMILTGATLNPGFALAGTKQVLMVVTSTDRIKEGKPTGLWLEEFAVPYLKFREAGFQVTVASTRGGKAPVDPRSLTEAAKVASWEEASRALEQTLPLERVEAGKYAAIFLPGGHGTMFDFPGNEDLQDLLQQFSGANKVIAAVCHGPAGLVGVTDGDGNPLVAGKTVTAFTDAEEKAVAMDKEMPFLLETKLREVGAKFVAGEKWVSHVEVDGKLVTGQNPASSAATADAVIRLLTR